MKTQNHWDSVAEAQFEIPRIIDELHGYDESGATEDWDVSFGSNADLQEAITGINKVGCGFSAVEIQGDGIAHLLRINYA
tara:strand:- start:302 stop:541 length:240 start_codon:yes stop_codon:yes gene_type:complete